MNLALVLPSLKTTLLNCSFRLTPLICVTVFILTCHCISTGQDLSQDLLLHYEFNGNALDDSGNGHHATPFNVTDDIDRFTTPTESYQFNGTNSYLETPSDPQLRPDFPFTIAYWINPIVNNQGFHILFSPNYEQDLYYGPWAAYWSNNNIVVFAYGDGGATTSAHRISTLCQDELRTGDWNQITGVYTSPTNVDIYINGCPCSNYSTSGTGGPLAYSNNGGVIGKQSIGGTTLFEGQLDDIYFWSRALTQLDVDVLNDYHPGTPDFSLGNDTIICDGAEVNLSLPADFTNVQWSTGEFGNMITVDEEGLVWAVGEDMDCGIHRDTILIEFFEPAESMVNENLCFGDTLVIAGTEFTTAGQFSVVLPDASFHGCDSTLFIEINTITPTTSHIDTVICPGSSFTYLDSIFQSPGLHYYVFENTAANGCDSILEFDLSFYSAAESFLNDILCMEDSLMVNGTYYHFGNPSGVETVSMASVNGCDSTININLSFLPTVVGSYSDTLCSGDSIIINGQTFNETNPAASVIFENASALGCDSVVNVNIQFQNSVEFDLIRELCPGDSILVNGTTYDEANPSGIETLLMGSAAGCDSIINVDLSFLLEPTGLFQRTLCSGDSVIINGQSFNESNPTGTVIFQNGSSQGCDSIVSIEIQFQNSIEFDLIRELCPGDSILVNGVTYNETNTTGMETIVMGSAAGCDSIINVDLSFLLEPTGLFQRTLCSGDSIVINGQTFNESNPNGTVIFQNGSSQGCDSIVNVEIQFQNSVEFDLIRELCPGDSILVNGATYNEANSSGTETLLMGSAAGCDSIINVDLSFLLEPTGLFQHTLCSGDSIIINGQTFNESNSTGTVIFQNGSAQGCDSIVNVDIQFQNSVQFDLIRELCPGDSILVNGVTYNEANTTGMETIIMGSTAGCDSIINVDLSFLLEPTGLFQRTLCSGDSIVINGQTFNESNPNGTVIFQNGSAQGCDSVVNIILLFDNEIIINIFDTLIGNETVTINGETYSTAGSFTILNVPSASGCDSIVILNLTQVSEDLNIYIPNAFSPNNDQINDFFGVYGSTQIQSIQLDIYNRWGGKVFGITSNLSAFNQEKLWDGNCGEKACQEGVYVYVLRIINNELESQYYSGELLLLR